ncbi:ABC transporter permease [Gordonia jinghuaiqii]|nr:ABC transporter permease [Gordonia jinghuaiqii]
MATPSPAHTDKSDDTVSAHDATDAELEAAKQARKMKIGRYGFAFVFPFLMVVMMITGYLGSMHDPQPNDMPIAVAGSTPDAERFAATLENAGADAVDIRVVDSAETARQMVVDREASGAVVLPTAVDDTSATVYTAGSAGASQATAVTGLVAPHLAAEGLRIQSEDLVPLPAEDSAGLAPMFMVTALILAGYMPLSLLLSSAPELLRLRRIVPILAAWSGIASLLTWIIAGPVLGAAQGSAWEVLGIGWLAVFAVGAVQLFLTRILGPLAVLAGMLFLMVLGIPASNMGMSVYTMPGIFPWLHGFLPTPAAGEAFRSVMYFDGNGVGGHLVVLVIGAVLALAAVAGIDAVKRRRNHEEPVQSMVSMTGGVKPPKTWVRYALLAFFPLAMVAMMLSAMLGGMGEPTPRNMPVAVVGSSEAQAEQARDGFQSSMPGLFELTATTSADDAEAAVRDREIVAAYVLPSAENPSATLITNGAAGMSAQQVVQTVFGQVAQSQGMTLNITDLTPLDSQDSVGTVSLYLAIGWIMSGFLLIIVLANAAPDLMRKRILVPIMAGWSVFMSVVLWVIADLIVGAIDGHFLPLFGLGLAAIFSTALFTTVFTRMIGLLAVLPVVAVLMFLGVPASGGGLSVYMTPDIFRFLHDVLPLPAAVESARSILYFGGDVTSTHLLTFGIWAVASFAALLILDRFFARPPQPIPGQPVSQDAVDEKTAVADDAEIASASR